MGPQLLNAAGTAIITVVVVFVLVVGAGFWLLARRKSRGGSSDDFAALHQKANILLVRVDDAIKNGEDELGYAIAQFGDVKAKDFEAVLAQSKLQVKEAFELQQKLDDAYPDTETQRREWNARVVHLCETAHAALDEQEGAFAELRLRQKNAPDSLTTLTQAIAATTARIPRAEESLSSLRADFAPTAIASVADNISRGKAELDAAADGADKAARLLASSDAVTVGGSAVDTIRRAEEHVYRAGKLLDALEGLRQELTGARDAARNLRDSTRGSLTEARALRDAPPDPAVGAAIGRAIVTVEAAVAADPDLRDPLSTLEILRSANAELDASLAGARNQEQRLAGARTALVGALVGARSQIASTRAFIDARRGGVGSEARTRLAEAERLLAVADAETDPVAALDTARSSATYSRDADALARFDLQHR